MVLVTGMIIGTVFTLFVVPVFYSLIAAEHAPAFSGAGSARSYDDDYQHVGGPVLEPAMGD
jgi:multidrug efflux pump